MVHTCLIHSKKAFDRVERKEVWNSQRRRGIEENITGIIKTVYKGNANQIITREGESISYVLNPLKLLIIILMIL